MLVLSHALCSLAFSRVGVGLWNRFVLGCVLRFLVFSFCDRAHQSSVDGRIGAHRNIPLLVSHRHAAPHWLRSVEGMRMSPGVSSGSGFFTSHSLSLSSSLAIARLACLSSAWVFVRFLLLVYFQSPWHPKFEDTDISDCSLDKDRLVILAFLSLVSSNRPARLVVPHRNSIPTLILRLGARSSFPLLSPLRGLPRCCWYPSPGIGRWLLSALYSLCLFDCCSRQLARDPGWPLPQVTMPTIKRKGLSHSLTPTLPSTKNSRNSVHAILCLSRDIAAMVS